MLYLDLLKRTLTRSSFADLEWHEIRPRKIGLLSIAQRALNARDYHIMYRGQADGAARHEGTDWPADAETMIGMRRLDNLQQCIETVIADDVPGDLLEAGVWRGGATIFMRGVLAAHGVTDRLVWVADSFEGLPKPDFERYPADGGDTHWLLTRLRVDVGEVRRNFERYQLLDDQVRFLEGWFADTLPNAPFEHLAVARLDGDMYSSTWDSITALYPRLSPGGFLIVDDYALEGCRAAIDEYRAKEGIAAPLEHVDWTGVFWRKEG